MHKENHIAPSLPLQQRHLVIILQLLGITEDYDKPAVLKNTQVFFQVRFHIFYSFLFYGFFKQDTEVTFQSNAYLQIIF